MTPSSCTVATQSWIVRRPALKAWILARQSHSSRRRFVWDILWSNLSWWISLWMCTATRSNSLYTMYISMRCLCRLSVYYYLFFVWLISITFLLSDCWEALIIFSSELCARHKGRTERETLNVLLTSNIHLCWEARKRLNIFNFDIE